MAVKERDNMIRDKDILLTSMYQELSSIKQEDITLGQYDDTFDGMKKAIHDRDSIILNLKSQLQQAQSDIELLSKELVKLEVKFISLYYLINYNL